jgi:transcriptional regulator with XRE-family HTH domain
MADIETLKAIKKQKKLTLQEIADASGIPKRTVDDIFSGKTKHPRIDTMQAIERALGITPGQEVLPEYTEEEKQLFELIQQLTDEEAKELSNFVDYILSKRK